LLIRGNSPFLSPTPVTPELPEFVAAVMICANTWAENVGIRRDWLIGLKMRIWRWRRRKMDYNVELSKFIDYLVDGSLQFPLSNTVKPGKQTPRLPGSPFLLRLHSHIMSHLRLSESDAWDYPVGLAKMRWAAHWEQEGGLEVYNDHDADFDKYVEEQDAKEAEAMKVKEAANA
jgi:hypothetical protein